MPHAKGGLVEALKKLPLFNGLPMMTAGMNILLVGPDFRIGQSLPNQLHQWGFRCHFAETARLASELVSSKQVDVVLTTTHLPDGSGFRLAAALSGLAVTAFLSVPVEDGCLWLPAMDRRRMCLGSSALRPPEFARAIKALSLRERDGSLAEIFARNEC